MIKKLVIALALAASVVAIAAPTFASHSHGPTIQGDRVCSACDGTGRSWGSGGKGTGNYKCWQCKGTGFIGGY